MSRTVITEDDLAPTPPTQTGEHHVPAPNPAPAPAGVAERWGRWLVPGAAVLAVLALGGAFFLGQATRASDDEVAIEVRDAIREVRDGMRAERAAITARAVARSRKELSAKHRRDLAALRRKYGIPAPVRAAAAPAQAPVQRAAPAVRAPAPVQAPAPNRPSADIPQQAPKNTPGSGSKPPANADGGSLR